MRMIKNRNDGRGGRLWKFALLCAGILALFLSQGAADAPEAYRGQWQLDMEAESRQHLILEMSAVNVVVEAYDGRMLEIVLEATRSPSSSGELPEVTVEFTEEIISIAETYPMQGKLPFFGDWTSGELQGTLTLRIPRGQTLAELAIQSFSGEVLVDGVNAAALYVSVSSGGISARDCAIEYGAALETFSGMLEATGIEAESLHLASSSGGIRVHRVHTSDFCIAESFAGDLDILEVESGALELGSSSGGIALETAWAASAAMNTFSGPVFVQGLAVENGVIITTSSGQIALQSLTAQSLETQQFSGALDFADVRLSDNAGMTSSSGSLKGVGLTAGAVEMETFSGDISLAEGSVEALHVKTSSGNCTVQLAREAETTMTSFSGDIALSLPGDCSFDYVIDTFSGSVEFGFEATRQDSASPSAQTGQVGQGGPSIRIDTSSGAIVVVAEDKPV